MSGAPADGNGWPERDILSVSGTTAFKPGIGQRDRFLDCVFSPIDDAAVSSVVGQRYCIIAGRSHPALFQQNLSRHTVSPLEEDTVSRVSYTSPFSKIKIRHSGEFLSSPFGYLRRPNINQNTNRIMAYCVRFIVPLFMAHTFFIRFFPDVIFNGLALRQ